MLTETIAEAKPAPAMRQLSYAEALREALHQAADKHEQENIESRKKLS